MLLEVLLSWGAKLDGGKLVTMMPSARTQAALPAAVDSLEL